MVMVNGYIHESVGSSLDIVTSDETVNAFETKKAAEIKLKGN